MLKLTSQRIRRVLLLGAHSDDIEIGAGGTLMAWREQHPACEIRWVVFSGDAQRRAEAEASAAQFLQGHAGETRVQFESFRDGYFPSEYEGIKDRLQAIAHDYSPDVVLTHHRSDLHQDHRLLSELTHNAFRDHWILQYEIPKYDGDLGNPGLFIPLTQEVASKKIELLQNHFQSQQDKPWYCEDTFWAMLRLRGMQCRSASGLAEGFYCEKSCL